MTSSEANDSSHDEPTLLRREHEGVEDRHGPRGNPPKVVVGIDGSPASVAALRWALGYADTIGASVHAVAVWDEPFQIAGADLAPMSSDFEHEARRWLTNAVSDTSPQSQLVQTHAEQGHPSEELLKYARDAELPALGNHGRGALQAIALGSVAHSCAHRAPCPVVLVPSPS